MSAYTHGYENTVVEDPLVVHINGTDYYLGRKSPNYRIVVWVFQSPDKDEFGLPVLKKKQDSDDHQQCLAKVLYVPDNAFPERIYGGQECCVGDWIAVARYQLRKWHISIGAEKVDGKWVPSAKEVPKITIGVISPEFIANSFGSQVNPTFVDTTIHIGK